MSSVSKEWLERTAADCIDESAKWDFVGWVDSYFGGLDPAGGGNTWRHVPLDHMTITDTYVAGNYVKPLAAQYIAFPSTVQNAHADWLVADSLCYAEVNATLVHWRMMKAGKQAIPFGLRAGLVGWSLFLWLIWICVLGVGFALNTWIGVGLLALTAWVQYSKLRVSMQRRRLVAEMLGTYQALSSSTFSWAVLWEHMAESRKLGAVWPPELYRLVELRMHR